MLAEKKWELIIETMRATTIVGQLGSAICASDSIVDRRSMIVGLL